jgi:hypothetical protein
LKIENSAINITNTSDTITTTKSDINDKTKVRQITTSNFVWLLDRNIEDVTTGLRPEFSRDLHNISEENALTITNYILAMRIEINLSNNYRGNNISMLCKLKISRK